MSNQLQIVRYNLVSQFYVFHVVVVVGAALLVASSPANTSAILFGPETRTALAIACVGLITEMGLCVGIISRFVSKKSVSNPPFTLLLFVMGVGSVSFIMTILVLSIKAAY